MKLPILNHAIMAAYHGAHAAALEERDRVFPRDSFVHVDCTRYKGHGLVCLPGDGCRPDEIAVRLENGNVWHYPMKFCRRVGVSDPALPRWLRRLRRRFLKFLREHRLHFTSASVRR